MLYTVQYREIWKIMKIGWHRQTTTNVSTKYHIVYIHSSGLF